MPPASHTRNVTSGDVSPRRVLPAPVLITRPQAVAPVLVLEKTVPQEYVLAEPVNTVSIPAKAAVALASSPSLHARLVHVILKALASKVMLTTEAAVSLLARQQIAPEGSVRAVSVRWWPPPHKAAAGTLSLQGNARPGPATRKEHADICQAPTEAAVPTSPPRWTASAGHALQAPVFLPPA